jgi:hypothetical protein
LMKSEKDKKATAMMPVSAFGYVVRLGTIPIDAERYGLRDRDHCRVLGS